MGRFVLPALLAGVAGGVFAADAGWLPPSLRLAVTAAGCGVAFVGAISRRPALLAVTVLLVGAAAGAWRESMSALPTGPGSVAAAIGAGERTYLATVSDDPRPKGDRQQAVVDSVSVVDGERDAPLAGRILVWLPRGIELRSGDALRFSASLQVAQDFDGFAYRAYLARQGVAAVARTYDASVVEHRGGIGDVAASLRRWLLDGLNATIPEPQAALAAGILLGVRSSISPEINDAFAAAGLTHVVAISGWNIAIVVGIMTAALQPLRRRVGGGPALSLLLAAVVAGYVVLTGASPSVVRAALMTGALLLARLGGSRTAASSALELAAVAMLLVSPAVLWDVGFQLSLLATAGLIWFGAAAERRLAALPGMVREPVSLTLAAQITTLPVILLNFERLSLVAPLANVLVVPLVPLVMLCTAFAAPIGALSTIVHVPVVSEAALWLAGGAAWLYLQLMILLGGAAAAVPFASIAVTPPAWLALAWYPCIALVALRQRVPAPDRSPSRALKADASGVERLVRRLARPLPLAAGTALILAVVSVASLPDGRLHLNVLDVGQGDAILVSSATGRTLLVDGGPDPELTLRRIGAALPFYARRLDVVLLTHPHQDHVGGLVEVLRRYDVGLVLDGARAYDNPSYRSFLQLAAAEPGARVVTARAGQQIGLDGTTTLSVLYPSSTDAAARLPANDINNASVVVELRFRAFRALLAGDAEQPVEAMLLDRRLLEPVDVLKVGHHGSRSSSSAPFLAAVRPAVALISDGIDNEYGHPHAVTLRALAAVGARVHRTDLEGDLRVTTDGRAVAVATSRGTDATLAVRGSAPRGRVPGSIVAWQSPGSTTLARSSCPTSCPKGSWSTSRACAGSPRKRREWCNAPAYRSTSGSSRSPPCSTTSTSWRRAIRSTTASSPRAA